MFTYRSFQKTQPISYTGILPHVYKWIISGTSDVFIDNPRYVPPIGGKGAVLCFIHGTADRSNSFCGVIADILPKLDHSISKIFLPSFDYRCYGLGIDDYADQFAKKLLQHNITHVYVGGHSRGGLVAAYFAEYLAQKYGITVHFVFTICTPWDGSPIAHGPFSYWSKSVKQMQPGSPFLKELNEKTKETVTTYFNVAAENDYLVSKESACAVAKPENCKVFLRHGHLSIMSSHEMPVFLVQATKQVAKLAKLKFPALAHAEEALTPLIEIEIDLNIEINRLKTQLHMCSVEEKIKVLELLQAEFKNCSLDNKYKAKTITEFIEAFLSEKNVNQQKTNIEIIKEKLNYSLYFFEVEKPKTLIFFEEQLQKFKDIEIPPCVNKKDLQERPTV